LEKFTIRWFYTLASLVVCAYLHFSYNELYKDHREKTIGWK
jgi:hypothetical protein